MSKKQFSMQKYWQDLAAAHKPQLSFSANGETDFKSWHEKAYKKFVELLGPMPEKTALDAEIEKSWEKDGLVWERVVFDSEENMSVPCYVIKPAKMKCDGTNAAIICSHGHGKFGKDAVAGLDYSPELIENIKTNNYDYARQMAREGFLTISLDLRGFGERRDGENPFPGRDPCNINFLKGSMFGINTLAQNIWDVGCCIDYLCTRAEVDPERIGMMGLSQGGTMTTFASAYDKRIKAADIICYVNPFEEFAIGRANWCGSQMVPQLYKYFDTMDIAGLIAPRALLMEMGTKDECFYIEQTLKGFEGTKKIYEAANAGALLHDDVFEGTHAFSGIKAFEFFKKYL